jgi:predicted RNase H-like nuclease (RuvC/YqgF family)
VKLKDENTSLKEDLENKQKTIELLQQKVDSIKVK